MKILPIGVNGPYPAAGGATSCYLVVGDGGKVVLDLGSGALSALLKVTDPESVEAFVLTHLHYDHFCDALPLAYMPGRRVIYAPCAPAECFCLLKNRRNFDVRVLGESLRLSLGGMDFEFMRTAHGVECYAVKVTAGGVSFVYTSDTEWTDKLVPFCRGAKLVLADCCAAAGAPHMTAAGGAKLARLTGAKVVATHVPPNSDAAARCRAAGLELIEAGREIIV